MKSKKGSIMVESAIVIPIIILISISTIYYAIFQYENLRLQLRSHQQLLNLCNQETFGLVKIEEKTRQNSIDLGGITKDIIKKEMRSQKYIIDFEKSARCFNVY